MPLVAWPLPQSSKCQTLDMILEAAGFYGLLLLKYGRMWVTAHGVDHCMSLAVQEIQRLKSELE